MQGGFGGPPTGGEDPVIRAASFAVEAALTGFDGPVHRPAAAEWGLAVDTGHGWPLPIGMAVRGGLLRVQAEVCGPGQVPGSWLLHHNRRTLLIVRYGTSAAGVLWVHGELPADNLTAAAVDALLARTVGAALEARDAAHEGPARGGPSHEGPGASAPPHEDPGGSGPPQDPDRRLPLRHPPAGQ